MTKDEAIALSDRIGGLATPEEKSALWDLAMKHIPEGGIALEVGTWTGGSAVMFGEICRQKNAKFICVDGFTTDMDGVRGGLQVDCFRTVVDNTRGMPVEFICGNSVEIVKYLRPESVDFLYVDGAHFLPTVKEDIEGYYEIVKPGGLYLGHDYNDTCDVKGVVDSFIRPKGEFNLVGRVWYVTKGQV